MKRNRFSVLTVPLVLATIAAWPLVSSATPTLSIEPPNQVVNVGDGVSLDVSVADVTDLFGYQFDVAFNPLVLAAQSITEGTFLSGGGSTFFIPGNIDNVAGIINFTANTLIGAIPGVNGGGVLAQMNFSAMGAGNSAVNFSGVTLLDSTLSDISVLIVPGSVQVQSSAVPEPASLWLVASGIGWLGATRLYKVARRK